MNPLFAEPEVSTRTLLFPKGTDQPIMEMGGVTGAVGITKVVVTKTPHPVVDGHFRPNTNDLKIKEPENPQFHSYALSCWIHELGHAVDRFLHPTEAEAEFAMYQQLQRYEGMAVMECIACEVQKRIGARYGLSRVLIRTTIEGREDCLTLDDATDAYAAKYCKMGYVERSEIQPVVSRRVENILKFMEPYVGISEKVENLEYRKAESIFESLLGY